MSVLAVVDSATNNMVVAQVLTFAIPVGAFFAICLWGFFQRRRSA